MASMSLNGIIAASFLVLITIIPNSEYSSEGNSGSIKGICFFKPKIGRAH